MEKGNMKCGHSTVKKSHIDNFHPENSIFDMEIIVFPLFFY